MKISIAHITTLDLSILGLLLKQLNSIQLAGYAVTGISSPGPYVPEIVAAGIEHIPINMRRDIRPLQDLSSFWQLYRLLKRHRFDIVHTHNPKPGLIGQLAARLAGVPIVVNTVHGFYFHEHMPPAQRRFFVALERIAASCSDLILSQNREDMDFAISSGICRPEKIKHLGNGIDVSQFNRDMIPSHVTQQVRSAIGLPEGVPVVGFVGRLAARRKGFLDFLAAGRRVMKQLPDTRFMIIGQSDQGKTDAVSPKIARDYGIEQNCIFLGRRPNLEMPGLYTLMDVLVLPSLFEGMPRAVMEASAMEVPAVVTNVKGNREVVEHGRNGLMVPLGDVPALAESIVELLTDREKARRMGREGRSLSLERFDEQLVFERVKTEYARLLYEKGLPMPAPVSAL